MFFYNLKKHEKDGSFTSMMFLFNSARLESKNVFFFSVGTQSFLLRVTCFWHKSALRMHQGTPV